MPSQVIELPLAEAVVLCLIAHEPRHGWAVVKALAPASDVGRVWSLSRPLTYRAIDGLLAKSLITRKGAERGEGPQRQILAVTALGRRVSERWLSQPVSHFRDVRTELMLKLVLLNHLDRSPAALVQSQLEVFRPMLAALEEARAGPDVELVDIWRFESSLAVRRFLEQAAQLNGTSEVVSPAGVGPLSPRRGRT